LYRSALYLWGYSVLLRISEVISAGGRIERLAQEYVARMLVELDYVGVLAVEFFQKDGQLLANEMAPRVHNSGHWTIEGAQISQFENHLRAICKLPLGSTVARGRTAMLNFIGNLPPLPELLSIPEAHCHVYGKEPRAGRKLGHVTLCLADEKKYGLQLKELHQLVK
jgi:5-(carboxyamino)imidazole ribonucleotide synthase